MNFRFTVALLVVLAALGTAIVLTGGSQQAEVQSGSNHDLQVFRVEADEVERLELRRGSESRLFQRSGGDWFVQPDGERADQVEIAVSRLAGLRATRRIEAGETDLTAFGLVTPKLVVQLGLANGTTRLLHIGDSTPVQTGYYAQAQSGSEVYVLASVLVSDLERLVDEPTPPTPTPAGNTGVGTPLPLGTPTLPASSVPMLGP